MVGNPYRFVEQKSWIKGFLPLLYHSVQRNRIPVDGTFLSFLKTATFYEELRSNTYYHILQETSSSLAHKQIPFILLRGASLIDHVYDHRYLRHCHDIDILIKDENMLSAAEALTQTGTFKPPIELGKVFDDILLTHETGMPVYLRRDLFRGDYYRLPLDQLWEERHEIDLGGVKASILSTIDSLIYILGHAFCSPGRVSLRWVTDAWFIVHKNKNLDYQKLFCALDKSRLILPAWVMFHYLAEQLGLPLEEDFLRRLKTAALKTDKFDREKALSAICARGYFCLTDLLRQTKDLSTKFCLVVWRVKNMAKGIV